MKNIDYFKNKKVAVVGLARSGVCCANLLFDSGAQVFVTDQNDNLVTRQNASKLKSEKIKFELGRHSKEFIKDKDIVVISPGVTSLSLPVVWARENNIPIISEIEAGFILCPAPIIAVTGSSGKTTVTTLIGKIIEASGKKSFVCGNIGNPFTGEISKIDKDDFVVLEVSSFQLESISDFKPKVSVILNFSKNHLDRHKDMQEYFDAKKRIFLNQDAADYLILNNNDPLLKPLALQAKAKVVYFSQANDINPNQAAVLAVASVLGINKDKCFKVFEEFKGLEHRFEFVAEINKVKFINDSKATVVESTIWAIKNISGKVILIAGGKDKGVDYAGILPEAEGKVRAVVLIGEAKDIIRKALGNALDIFEAASLEEAVNFAYEKAGPGDSVLLSPMCSSFDMFTNYEERGRVFKQAVGNLPQA